MKFASKSAFSLLFALSACSSAGTPATRPSPSASPSAMPSATPSPTYTTAPALDDSNTPPPQTSPTPSGEPKLSCEASNNNVHGTVLDAAGKPVADAEIKLTVNDPEFQKQCPAISSMTVRTDSQGNYQFGGVVTGVISDLTASKAGYASQTRVEVPTSRAGDDAINRYDFKLVAN